MKSADGRVLRKPVEVRKRWEEYFRELLNEEFARREVQEEQPTEGPIPSWTQEEVRSAIGKMKLGKAPGPNGVPVEAWKILGNCGVNWLTQFFNRVTIEDMIKVYERLVDSRLRRMVAISQEQWGFMPERSTTDTIFIARQVMEKYREKRETKALYLAFLDLEKAYDRLSRVVLWNSLRGRGVPERLISVIKDMYEGSKAAVRTPHGMTKKMDITVGTDDIALVADSREELEEKQGALAGNGLRNVRKTKFISSEQCTEPILDCQGEVMEKVEQFRYLGSDLSEEGSVD
ncbi:unnamed protein product [Heligmosomoides polygyrus]|uniref:Reverse transcriptase domain-containing protein n=1 Tax=Heligmosomoides polygyrus TaxID=6339 RepID=A0A183GJ50_HELPZ|nr:unnamed protein product [Heligmosomoides polygyrus]